MAEKDSVQLGGDIPDTKVVDIPYEDSSSVNMTVPAHLTIV